jgi:predicted MPP superfamily phosphohydrolase
MGDSSMGDTGGTEGLVGMEGTDVVEQPDPSGTGAHAARVPLRERPAVRRVLTAVAVLLVAALGTGLGMLVVTPDESRVGPVQTRMGLGYGSGGTVVDMSPLGALRLDSHRGPFQLTVDVSGIDIDATRQVISTPSSVESLEQRVAGDVRDGIVHAVLIGTGAAVVFAGWLGFLVFRTVRRTAATSAAALALVAAGGGLAAVTWNPDSISEPEYQGLLTTAPTLVGDAEDIIDNFGLYRAQLAKIVTNVGALYAAGSSLPVFTQSESTVRILHVSDIHLNPTAWNVIRSVAAQFQVHAVIDTGDLTDHGTAFESRFADSIPTVGVPYIWIRGNHDSRATQQAVASQSNAIVLDEGGVTEVEGIRITGWGDPRFTPDQETRDKEPANSVLRSGEWLAEAIRAQDPAPHLALVHDPAAAEPLDGLVPLVLAGHGHHRETYAMEQSTLVFEQGSTGGAGLRALEDEEPTPLQCAVLYFDRATGELQAWDDVTLGGIGLASANIERHLPGEEQQPEITPPPPTPGVTPTRTAPAPGDGATAPSPTPAGR